MTKQEWDKLPGKPRWDVQVALRGPDVKHSEPIKWVTTSVIRGHMSKIIRVGGTVNDDLKVVIIPDNPSKKDYEWQKVPFAFSPGHFFNHVHEAALVLGIKVHEYDTDDYFKAMTEQAVHMAVIRLWKGAEEAKLKDELSRHLKSIFHIDSTKSSFAELEAQWQ